MPDTDTDTPAGRLRYWANVDEANRPMSDNTTAGYLTAPLERSDVRAVLADNERLTAELEKYTQWEPTVREEYEHACRESDRFAALLCVCAESVPPEHFDPDAQCPVHGDPAKALSLRAVMAERDLLRARVAAARAEIRRQDLRRFTAVSDALAAVETHLVDPQHRPATANGASQ